MVTDERDLQSKARAFAATRSVKMALRRWVGRYRHVEVSSLLATAHASTSRERRMRCIKSAHSAKACIFG